MTSDEALENSITVASTLLASSDIAYQRQLEEVALLELHGRDASARRALLTLLEYDLHSNEQWLEALYGWRNEIKPTQ